jgi:hypothetical protein
LHCSDTNSGEVHVIQGIRFGVDQFEPPVEKIKQSWGVNVADVYQNIACNVGADDITRTEFAVLPQSSKPMDKGIIVSNQVGGSHISLTSQLLVTDVQKEYFE